MQVILRTRKAACTYSSDFTLLQHTWEPLSIWMVTPVVAAPQKVWWSFRVICISCYYLCHRSSSAHSLPRPVFSVSAAKHHLLVVPNTGWLLSLRKSILAPSTFCQAAKMSCVLQPISVRVENGNFSAMSSRLKAIDRRIISKLSVQVRAEKLIKVKGIFSSVSPFISTPWGKFLLDDFGHLIVKRFRRGAWWFFFLGCLVPVLLAVCSSGYKSS